MMRRAAEGLGNSHVQLLEQLTAAQTNKRQDGKPRKSELDLMKDPMFKQIAQDAANIALGKPTASARIKTEKDKAFSQIEINATPEMIDLPTQQQTPKSRTPSTLPANIQQEVNNRNKPAKQSWREKLLRKPKQQQQQQQQPKQTRQERKNQKWFNNYQNKANKNQQKQDKKINANKRKNNKPKNLKLREAHEAMIANNEAKQRRNEENARRNAERVAEKPVSNGGI